ncbi:MAG: T9SS type A sorting domain-containing protein [Bacteroidetes bacterium]|nr:T9SS type A sorting domain-containing protein [Bacteroidota bacterium]
MKCKLVSCFLLLNIVLLAQVPTNSLSAYYPFNNNTLDYIGTRHGVSAGVAQYGTDRWGTPNACYDVVDNTNYINLPSDNWIHGDYSISAWVNVKQVMSYPRLYDFSNGYMINDAVGELSHSGSGHVGPAMGYCVNSSTESHYFSMNALSLNDWHHVVYISSGTQMQIYVDNVLDGSIIGNCTPENVYRVHNKIGGSNAPLNDATKAYIDDFRLYDRAITPEEVGQLFYEPQSSVGVHEYKTLIEHLTISPNPSSDFLNVDFLSDSDKETVIELFDNIGKSLSVHKYPTVVGQNKMVVALDNLAAGFYHLTISTNSKSQNMKFVKN